MLKRFTTFLMETTAREELFKRHSYMTELDPNYGQEDNVQGLLFGGNDYIPFRNAINIKESVNIDPTNDKRLVISDSREGKATSAADHISVPRHMWEDHTTNYSKTQEWTTSNGWQY